MSYESPASILFDIGGNAMAVTGGFEVPVSTSALLFAGMTNTGTASYVRTEQDGTVWVTGSFTLGGTTVITGTVSIGNQPTVNQGNSGSIGQSWFTTITNGTNVIGTGSSAPIFTQESVNTGSVVTSFAGTASIVALIPSASQVRRGVTIYNDSNKTLSVLFGSGTVNTTNNFSIKVSVGGFLEVPSYFMGPIYAIWPAGVTGNALVTEIFP